ncbi:MAG TPA: FAD-binding oxidoreductase [Candidatus Nanoarchaeia archaeon]|nr:FAD-binding oxidoreductase [Candidatus Nanoarchaeia archaeon]
MTDYDVLIIGAGILGLSTAYHIKLANQTLKILIVDKNVAAGLGSTVNSAAAFRCFFSSSSNLALANSSVEFYKHLQDDLAVDLKMKWCGYLWLFTENDYLQLFPILKDLQYKGWGNKEYKPEELSETLGLRTNLTDDPDAQKFGLGEVYKAVFVPKAGLIGVMSLVHFYESEFLRLGGEIRYNTQVTKLLVEPSAPLGLPGEPYFWQDAHVVGVETSAGVIKAKKTVVATGPWLAQLLDGIGVECHVKSKKRQVFSVKAETASLMKLLHTNQFSTTGSIPFTILPKPHVYIRPNLEGEGFGVAYSDDFPRAFQVEEHPKPEMDFYSHGLQPVVEKYLPQFEGATSTGGFAGLYEINTIDEQPVIFEQHGVMVVGGGSGSGIMKADAIGRIATAAYAGEEYATLYGGTRFKVSDLGLRKRKVEEEKLVI